MFLYWYHGICRLYIFVYIYLVFLVRRDQCVEIITYVQRSGICHGLRIWNLSYLLQSYHRMGSSISFQLFY
jgi:hypothetical protein